MNYKAKTSISMIKPLKKTAAEKRMERNIKNEAIANEIRATRQEDLTMSQLAWQHENMMTDDPFKKVCKKCSKSFIPGKIDKLLCPICSEKGDYFSDLDARVKPMRAEDIPLNVVI